MLNSIASFDYVANQLFLPRIFWHFEQISYISSIECNLGFCFGVA